MTLVEVLISLAVFAVGILGIMPMFLYSSAQMRLQKDKEQVTQIVVDWMGKLDAVPYVELTQVKAAELLAEAANNGTFSIAEDPNLPPELSFPDDWGSILAPTGLLYQLRIDIDDADDSTTWEAFEGEAMPGVDFKQYRLEVRWKSLGTKENKVVAAKIRMRNAPRIEGV